jgi:hypothetical protein
MLFRGLRAMVEKEIVFSLEGSKLMAEIMTAVAKLETGMRFEGEASSGHYSE